MKVILAGWLLTIAIGLAIAAAINLFGWWAIIVPVGVAVISAQDAKNRARR